MTHLWIPEAGRLLRPGGRLIFLRNSALLILCVPDAAEEPAGERLLPRRTESRKESHLGSEFTEVCEEAVCREAGSTKRFYPMVRAVRRKTTILLWRAHRWLYRCTGGRVGGTLIGLPVLLLTTTGRRTGRPHTVALTYWREDGDFVVVASNGGAARHPQWWLNLAARPKALVQTGRRTTAVAARRARGDERDRLWERVLTSYRGYGTYQRRTRRAIPVIVLEPTHSDRGGAL